MQRDRSQADDVEPHVFDQTNGVVDLGEQKPAGSDAAEVRRRTAAGVAMLSTQKP